ncbi:MAG: hypothetical protein EBU46_14510 [Nitrosomonadaceae bacterium]|uniref:hypothetical protein n=1 Tax=unclassified Nitrosomonas TaxID=2609265 RepID=UPI001DCF5208|nr:MULTISPECIES: hypothetical protein [unclassified Nitrosomonas]MDV6340868.1 hypothetical protein [Nitrosomonas sp. Is24]MDV6346672.1 hypothetical protein [Nitrosomonas sp. Is35]NBQ69961.1 hypothetical protein [Nitrosomonadaceae bacterium]
MIKQVIRIWASAALLSVALYSGLAAAHGKVNLEADICMRNVSGSMVHLSTYQPQYDPEAEYCTEIPKEGETLWVLDLVDQALRDMPIVVKIVRGTGQALSDTVTTLYSTNHSNGTIKGEFNLDPGQYTLFVTGEGVPPLHYEYPLRIQVTNYQDLFLKSIPYIITFLLIAFFTDKLLKRRQLES